MSWSAQDVAAGLKHLRRADPTLGDVIDRVGPFTLKLERSRFRMLVRSIISQQISTSAARTIRQRLETEVGRVTPERVSALSMKRLRGLGLSQQKANYIHDLASSVVDGRVNFRRCGRMTDEEVIEQLTQVKGIGRWTAQMFLMFSLGRLDVFPYDDLGLRSAMRNMYDLGELPDRATGHRIAAKWSPYATIASWYCWRSLELPDDG